MTAAGRFGSPGIRIISPEIATKNPAPADGIISLILTVNPVGRPSKEAWSDNEYCVLATQIGNWLNPCSVYFLILFFVIQWQY